MRIVPYLQVMPLVGTLLVFLVAPVVLIGVVSFWDYSEFDLIPDFVWTNYEELFESSVTYSIYLSTFKFTLLTWIFTLTIGFTVAYFLAFHVRSLKWQIVLFLLCTIPFWTSNIIRMIAWIPVLGRHGLVNQALLGMGVVDEPQEWLLYSDFAVVLAFVHLYTLFMVVPIFNSMMRIDRAVIEAAYDAGAGTFKTIWYVKQMKNLGIEVGLTNDQIDAYLTGLPWETDDHIASDPDPRHRLRQLQDTISKLFHAVRAPHLPQHLPIATLKWEVNMGAEHIGVLAEQRRELRSELVGIQRTQS